MSSRPTRLSDTEIKSHLARIPKWTLVDGKLHRDYKFADFVHAFGFMTRAALAAEAMNHHPDWSNVWNRVRVDLVTHDAGGITANDVQLAEKLESLATDAT